MWCNCELMGVRKRLCDLVTDSLRDVQQLHGKQTHTHTHTSVKSMSQGMVTADFPPTNLYLYFSLGPPPPTTTPGTFDIRHFHPLPFYFSLSLFKWPVPPTSIALLNAWCVIEPPLLQPTTILFIASEKKKIP